MNFDDYSSLLPHLRFSASFFSKLMFSETANLQYPTVAPPGTVISQEFLTEEPEDVAATSVLLLDVIPSLCDLLPMTSAMEGAYMDGMRSVLVKFCMDRNKYSQCYHFSKVWHLYWSFTCKTVT